MSTAAPSAPGKFVVDYQITLSDEDAAKMDAIAARARGLHGRRDPSAYHSGTPADQKTVRQHRRTMNPLKTVFPLASEVCLYYRGIKNPIDREFFRSQHEGEIAAGEKALQWEAEQAECKTIQSAPFKSTAWISERVEAQAEAVNARREKIFGEHSGIVM
jgi:hypothetical protein